MPVRMLQCKHIWILQCKQIGKRIVKLCVFGKVPLDAVTEKKTGNTSSCEWPYHNCVSNFPTSPVKCSLTLKYLRQS